VHADVYVHVQGVRTSSTMGWRDLPYDMEELILSHLSLGESARTFMTCRSFFTAFRRQLTQQQTAPYELAADWFGRNMIACIAAGVTRFLACEPLDPMLVEKGCGECRISADGELHIADNLGPTPMTSATHAAREILVWVSSLHSWVPTHMSIHLPTVDDGYVNIRVSRPLQRVVIAVAPCSGQDLVGVAFVQALLAWGLAPSALDASLHAEVHIEGLFYSDQGFRFTRSRRRAQILPILPLLAQHEKWKVVRWP
jgi:hypothetical protein